MSQSTTAYLDINSSEFAAYCCNAFANYKQMRKSHRKTSEAAYAQFITAVNACKEIMFRPTALCQTELNMRDGQVKKMAQLTFWQLAATKKQVAAFNKLLPHIKPSQLMAPLANNTVNILSLAYPNKKLTTAIIDHSFPSLSPQAKSILGGSTINAANLPETFKVYLGAVPKTAASAIRKHLNQIPEYPNNTPSELPEHLKALVRKSVELIKQQFKIKITYTDTILDANFIFAQREGPYFEAASFIGSTVTGAEKLRFGILLNQQAQEAYQKGYLASIVQLLLHEWAHILGLSHPKEHYLLHAKAATPFPSLTQPATPFFEGAKLLKSFMPHEVAALTALGIRTNPQTKSYVISGLTETTSYTSATTLIFEGQAENAGCNWLTQVNMMGCKLGSETVFGHFTRFNFTNAASPGLIFDGMTPQTLILGDHDILQFNVLSCGHHQSNLYRTGTAAALVIQAAPSKKCRPQGSLALTIFSDATIQDAKAPLVSRSRYATFELAALKPSTPPSSLPSPLATPTPSASATLLPPTASFNWSAAIVVLTLCLGLIAYAGYQHRANKQKRHRQ